MLSRSLRGSKSIDWKCEPFAKTEIENSLKRKSEVYSCTLPSSLWFSRPKITSHELVREQWIKIVPHRWLEMFCSIVLPEEPSNA